MSSIRIFLRFNYINKYSRTSFNVKTNPDICAIYPMQLTDENLCM